MIVAPMTPGSPLAITCCVIVDSDAAMKRSYSLMGGSFGYSLEPTDSVGLCTVTFSGIVAGSEIRVYLPDTTEVAGVETCTASQALVWPVYAMGSPNNIVRIVIIDLDWVIKEFNYTSVAGNQTIPVQQERDKWNKNPT